MDESRYSLDTMATSSVAELLPDKPTASEMSETLAYNKEISNQPSDYSEYETVAAAQSAMPRTLSKSRSPLSRANQSKVPPHYLANIDLEKEESFFAAPKSDWESLWLQTRPRKETNAVATRSGIYFGLVGTLLTIDFFAFVIAFGSLSALLVFMGQSNLDHIRELSPLQAQLFKISKVVIQIATLVWYFIGGASLLRFGVFRSYLSKQGWGYSLTLLVIHLLIVLIPPITIEKWLSSLFLAPLLVMIFVPKHIALSDTQADEQVANKQC